MSTIDNAISESALFANAKRNSHDKQLDADARMHMFIEDFRREVTYYGENGSAKRNRERYEFEIDNFNSFKATAKKGQDLVIHSIEIKDLKDAVIINFNHGNDITIERSYFEHNMFELTNDSVWTTTILVLSMGLGLVGLTHDEFKQHMEAA